MVVLLEYRLLENLAENEVAVLRIENETKFTTSENECPAPLNPCEIHSPGHGLGGVAQLPKPEGVASSKDPVQMIRTRGADRICISTLLQKGMNYGGEEVRT